MPKRCRLIHEPWEFQAKFKGNLRLEGIPVQATAENSREFDI
jgi:hypothetical protein